MTFFECVQVVLNMSSSVVMESVYLTVTDVMAMPTAMIRVMKITVSFFYKCYSHDRAIGLAMVIPCSYGWISFQV